MFPIKTCKFCSKCAPYIEATLQYVDCVRFFFLGGGNDKGFELCWCRLSTRLQVLSGVACWNVYDRASNSVVLPNVSVLYDRMPLYQPRVVRTTKLVRLFISWRLDPQDCGAICRTVSIKLYGNLIIPLLPAQAAACGRRLDFHPVDWN